MSECLAHGRPLVFVRRDFFNEEPFLRKMLEVRRYKRLLEVVASQG
jgi:L-arabinokinase